jgi:hypothetical protein
MGGLYNPPLLQNPADPMWNAGSLRGREIADTAPTDGQALIWSVVQNKWVPGAGGAGSVSWDDINGRPDLSVYALASALNNYVLGSDLATILGGYVTNSGLSTALNDYLLSADFTWGNLGGRPDLSVYALASALSDYLPSADFTWANLGGKPGVLISAIKSITNIWTTNSTAYIELGWVDASNNLRLEIPANTGERIKISPPSISVSDNIYTRLQRSTDGGTNWIDICLGDAAAGKEQTTWALTYGGGISTGIAYYGGLSLGSPVWDVAPSTGMMLYRIVSRVNQGILAIGRNVFDSQQHNNRWPAFVSAENWRQ